MYMINFDNDTLDRIAGLKNKMTIDDIKEAKERIERRKKKLINPEEDKKVIDRLNRKRTFELCLFGESNNAKVAVSLEKYNIPEFIKKNYYDLAVVYEEFQENAQDYTQAIIDDDNPGNIVFKGKAGTGKSYLAVSIMKYLMKKNKKVLYLNTTALKDSAYRAFNDGREKAKLERTKQFANRADLLILDDLGAESNSEADQLKSTSVTIQNLLYGLANHRVGKPTLITTNSNLDVLRAIYDERIISRLMPRDPHNIYNFDKLVDLRNRGEF